jgi:hypothetical protein
LGVGTANASVPIRRGTVEAASQAEQWLHTKQPVVTLAVEQADDMVTVDGAVLRSDTNHLTQLMCHWHGFAAMSLMYLDVC